MDKMKLYCYVDETGQDTQGHLFIVSVIILENREMTAQYLSELERRTGKGRLKWGRADLEKRLCYLEEIFTQKSCPLTIYYSMYNSTKEYRDATVLTIAKSIKTEENAKNTLFTVLVDGLNEKDQRYYGSQLRNMGLHPRKIRGVRKDENDALIRLADSICGFIRDIKENENERAVKIYQKAMKRICLLKYNPQK